MPVVAHHGPSDAPEPLFPSDFLHRYHYNAVAQIWICGENKLGKAWQFRGACKHDMRFSRDEKLDAWYTNMRSHTHKLATRAYEPTFVENKAIFTPLRLHIVIFNSSFHSWSSLLSILSYFCISLTVV